MSRSSRPLSAPACAAVGAVGAAALSLLLVTGVAPACAETTPGPVKDLGAPSVELHTGVSSLDGTVTVEGTRNGAKARIDATVLFGKDSAKLLPGARDRIRQVAKEFARKGPGKVRVAGYTDDLGPADNAGLAYTNALWVSVVFAAPPTELTTISVQIPQFGTITDVPLV